MSDQNGTWGGTSTSRSSWKGLNGWRKSYPDLPTVAVILPAAGCQVAGERTCVHEPLTPTPLDISPQPSLLLEAFFQLHGYRGWSASSLALFTHIQGLGVRGRLCILRGQGCCVAAGSFGSSSSLSLPNPTGCAQHRGQQDGDSSPSRVKARRVPWVQEVGFRGLLGREKEMGRPRPTLQGSLFFRHSHWPGDQGTTQQREGRT